MANNRRGNIHYIDATGVLTATKNIKVISILLTATAAAAVIVLQDPLDSLPILELRVAASGDTAPFYFLQSPLLFPNGIKVGTLTNAVAMIVYNGE